MNDNFVIQNARVIDTAQEIDEVTNITVVDGKIHSMGELYPDHFNVLDGSGCIVSPGWIDAHVHCYEHCTPIGINPDKYCLSRGITAVVDAGSAGATTYPGLKKFIIEQSRTRVYALLHIAMHGLASVGVETGYGRECDALSEVNTEHCLTRIQQNPDHIVGVKIRLGEDAAFDLKDEPEMFRRALDCARRANLPLMTHHSRSSIPTQVKDTGETLGCPTSLRSGDIYTHCFHGWRSTILDNQSGKLTLHPDVVAAQERGVYFDIGHGRGSFHWGVAEQSARLGFFPDIISTDIHIDNIDGPVYDLASVMSKLKHVGMSLTQVIKAVTQTPAKAIHKDHLIGSLMVGREADMTLFRLEDCDVELPDSSGQIRKVKQIIQPLRVWRAGKEYPIVEREEWPNRSKWPSLLSGWENLVVSDSEKPYYA